MCVCLGVSPVLLFAKVMSVPFSPVAHHLAHIDQVQLTHYEAVFLVISTV